MKFCYILIAIILFLFTTTQAKELFIDDEASIEVLSSNTAQETQTMLVKLQTPDYWAMYDDRLYGVGKYYNLKTLGTATATTVFNTFRWSDEVSGVCKKVVI